MPIVSVIVPNYNYARFLKRRIDSILNQTLTDYEIVLLDDASTDNSKDILSQYTNLPQVSGIFFNEKTPVFLSFSGRKGSNLPKGNIYGSLKLMT